jgi:RNA polymerase sigma-70 factor (family 1)
MIEHQNEAALLQRLKNGDTKAFLQIYNKYHLILYVYVLRFVKIPSLAEDVVQDVFLRIWESRQGIKPELSFAGYLFHISRNKVFKLMKKIANELELQNRVMIQLSEILESREVEQKLQWHIYNDHLQHAINLLPPQRQKVFKLCREEGRSYEQTAHELGISRNTVKEHMVLAMRSIKEYLHQNAEILFALIIMILSF